MTLQTAKRVADEAATGIYPLNELREALERIEATATRGARRTQRAWDRFDRRIKALNDAITNLTQADAQ